MLEEDVLAGGKGTRAQRTVKAVGPTIAMHAYAAKVDAERRFHLGARTAVQRLPAATCALDALLYVGGHVGLALALAGQLDDALDKAVAVLALQPQQRVRCGPHRSPVQRIRMGTSARIITDPARELRRWITLQGGHALGLNLFLAHPRGLA